jgi:lipopolysaccharide/colanic/teichoic acid biosynthesis glycosyltransferase
MHIFSRAIEAQSMHEDGSAEKGAGGMNRFSDQVAAFILLILTLPLLALVALAIKYESSGPVFEKQPQIGQGGRVCILLTFRTTRHAPDARAAWTRDVTRVGEFLRYTRIDTLPQLFNVLQGDLALYSRDGYRRALLG